jgi:RES domain-containing protein
LAADVETAIAEFKQSSPVLQPGTIVSYSVSLRQVADFSSGFDPAQWHPIWEDFFCDWRKLVLDKIEPPSWVAADMVLAAGFQGVLFPSAANKGGVNLVVYTGQLGAGDELVVNDPQGDLPRDQSSWRATPR